MTNENIPFSILDQLNNLELHIRDTDNDILFESYEILRELISDYFETERDNKIRRQFRRALKTELKNSYAEFNYRVYDEISEYADSFGAYLAHKIPDYHNRIQRYSKSDYQIDIYSTVSHVFDGESLYFGIEPNTGN